jgi:tetratricopeptide (TPR) repeat protein
VTLPDPEAYLAALVRIRDSAQQREFISRSQIAPSLSLVETLSGKIRELAWKDPPLADALSKTNMHLAAQVDSPAASAYAIRSRAQVLHTRRQCAEAQPLFEEAVTRFREAGLDAEAGRTLVTEIENLSYLSRYDEALRLEEPARQALQRAQDARYLTLIEVSLGNLYYRLNRYPDSLARYDAAEASKPDAATAAAIGMGRAHALTDMNRFDEAFSAYETTRRHCHQHGLKVWSDIVEHGISRMHMRRGNYSEALRILEELRRKHTEENDVRRAGLCDIDRAEIYLYLNLFEEAAAVASEAIRIFEDLGNRYEAALCLTYRGIAQFKLMKDSASAQAFAAAGAAFVAEGNDTWVAVVDLWLAQLLFRQQKFAEAAALSRRSAETLEAQQVFARAAQARVLSAQALKEIDDGQSAMEESRKAVAMLEDYRVPFVSFQALQVLGNMTEWQGNAVEAEQLYLRAISELESLRGTIQLDELRMSFGKDKYTVYENLVNLQLRRRDTSSAFAFVERSKSRTLIDLLERSVGTVWDDSDKTSPRALQIRRIREELNFLYSRVGEAGMSARMTALDPDTPQEIASRERELLKLLREAGSERRGWTSLQETTSVGVSGVQQLLDSGEALVEYYAIGNKLQAFVISPETCEVVRDLGDIQNVRSALRGLNFQLSKFRLGPEYLQQHRSALLASTQLHLKSLHDELVAPVRHHLQSARRWLVVPHQNLHYVPFHALWDGESYVVDSCEVTYAASATVFAVCRSRESSPATGPALIVAAPDESTPFIHEEVEALRALMPDARVLAGADATRQKLRQFAPAARRIHIATHGVFRGDNPRFSCLRLGNEWLNLHDIFNMQVGAEITTLSGCETGISGVLDGEELQGLAQGFLYAGAPALLVSLWMVNDRSTSQLMRAFYAGLENGLSRPAALRESMLAVKAASPHPYYWAPFMLMGKP